MSTKIEWTNETWNPVTGCTKVSQGCKHCYAERLWPKVSAAEAKREGAAHARPFTTIRLHDDRLDAPLRVRKPKRWFVNSMSDLFHEDIPDEFIERVFAVMAKAQQHQFQVLTKRAERMLNWFMVRALVNTGDELFDAARGRWPLPNVWLGVSVENQETADARIPLLLKVPAAVRFLSCEPLLGPIDLTRVAPNETPGGWRGTNALDDFQHPKVDWVISGGESGPGARPAHPDWFRSLRDQCAAADVAYFFKQWGEWVSLSQAEGPGQHHYFPDGAGVRRTGKKIAGRTLDGRTHDGFPA